jgi:CelD/BcsL family acetyltransferase involved in cellulose biosynthesis
MVLTEAIDFTSLEGEWDELYQSCPRATPFQSWAWLYSWWESYHEGYKLRLITVRDGELLVALLPLMVRRGRLLLLLGGDAMTPYSDVMTPYKDVLVREGWEGRVAEAAARALKELEGWWVADLRELRPEAAAWGLFREWDGPKTSVPITDYVLIHAKPWEDLLASLSRKLRGSVRRTLRRAEEDGVRSEPAGLQDAERAARRLVALHRELLQGRNIDPEHLTRRYEAFMEAAARRTTARGIGRISEFWRDDAVLISQFLLFDKDFAGAYRIGASREASWRYQFDTLCNWDAINVARGRGSAYVSFMDGPSQHKLRWADEVVSSHRVILGRTLASWIPYAGYHALRDGYYALQSYVHSEGAPRWVKKATDSYYALQSYVYSEDAPRWVKKATDSYWALRREYGYHALLYKYAARRLRKE